MEQMEYKFIIEQSTLVSSTFPYQMHFVFAVIQGLIALQIVIWAIRILKTKKETEQLIPKHLFITPARMKLKITGFIFLIYGLLLLTPFVFGLHYGFSTIVLISIIVFLLSSDWKINLRRKIGISLLLLGSILLFSFSVFEKLDPLEIGTRICFKGLKWRMYEQSWQEIHDANAPKVGKLAHDFMLKSTDGLDSIRISDFKGLKPVVLIFGSYSCPPHSDGTVIINRLYEKYNDTFEFVNVYIKEAHPTDKWNLGETNTQKAIYKMTGALAIIDANEPQNYQERCSRAGSYRKNLFNNKLPIYVDTMDDYVSELYAAKPTRIYLIGKDGRIIYNPGFGPMAFNPKHLKIEMEKYIKSVRNKYL